MPVAREVGNARNSEEFSSSTVKKFGGVCDEGNSGRNTLIVENVVPYATGWRKI